MSWRTAFLALAAGVAIATPGPPVRAEAAVLAPTMLVDQRGRAVTLPDGRPWILTFFYGHCPDVCPTLIYNVQDVAALLPPAVRDRVAVGAVTFDPARDTVAVLAAHAENYGLSRPDDYLLTGAPVAITGMLRTFAFDFKPDRNGGFQHATLTAVMDGEGRVRHHFYGLRPDLARIAEAVTGLVAGP